LDDVTPCDFELGDIVFVNRKYKNFISQYGYTGPGWMHRCQAEWLLYTAVITWQDIPWKLTATGRLPADLLREPLDRIEAAFENGAKQAINSMIGLWCLDEQFSYRLISSNHPGDAPQNAMKRITHYTGGQTVDYITKTRLASPKSHRPLHDLAMCSEAVRVGQMIYVLQKQRATIHEIKTDSCLYRPLKHARPCLETLAYNDLRVRDIFKPAGQRRLDEAHRLTVHMSEQLVYRV
jgi:hypothetical protein